MARDPNRLARRNEAIRREFVRLFGQGYRSAVIYEMLAERYYLSPATIADIVTRCRQA